MLRQTVLDPIGASLKQMMEGGGLFVLHKSNDDIVTVQYSCDDDETCFCNVPMHMFCVGDLNM